MLWRCMSDVWMLIRLLPVFGLRLLVLEAVLTHTFVVGALVAAKLLLQLLIRL